VGVPRQTSGGRPSLVSLQKAQQSLNERQVMFVAWEATPEKYRNPQTRAELCVQLGVSEVTGWRWAKDPKVQQAVRWMVLHHAGDPARISNVINYIYETVQDEQGTARLRLEAAREFLKAVGVYHAFTGKPDLLTTKDVSEIALDELSDDEIWNLYNERAGNNGLGIQASTAASVDSRAIGPSGDVSDASGDDVGASDDIVADGDA